MPDAAPPVPQAVEPPGEPWLPELPGLRQADPDGPRALDPRVRRVWTIEWVLTAAVITGAAVVGEIFADPWPIPRGLAAAVLGAGLAAGCVFMPRLEYERWSFRLRRHDVILSFGVIFRTCRSIPRPRIQHVDIKSGPISRYFGLVSLTLYTAGTGEADARIPGLVPAEAEELREKLLNAPGLHG